jgi:hypothetical protein
MIEPRTDRRGSGDLFGSCFALSFPAYGVRTAGMSLGLRGVCQYADEAKS